LLVRFDERHPTCQRRITQAFGTQAFNHRKVLQDRVCHPLNLVPVILIAAIQRSIVLFALVGLLTVTAWCAWLGHPLVWAPIIATVAFGHGMLLAVEFGLMCIVNRRGNVQMPTVGQVLIAWFNEVVLAIQVFAWRQPFRATAVPDLVNRSCVGSHGVVLIHGYACNRGIWNHWLRRLRHQAVPTIAVNLEPPWAAIDSYSPQIEHAVAAMESATGAAPILVAHSMGGLAARHWYGAQRNPARVHRLITLGSPHRGTWLARFALGANGRQMQPGSPFLRALQEADAETHLQRTTCFYSHCDNIVFPATNATIAGADNRHVEGCAHVQLIEHPACWGALQDFLSAGRPSAG
jgi:hypothetical protein